MQDGHKMYSWAQDLFPICRSITGPGLRQTLQYIKKLVPDLKIHSVLSGTKAFDWIVPDEWRITKAYIADKEGNHLIDYLENNLHIVGYSEPVNKWVSLKKLKEHLYSIPKQPHAIPYVTSYYKRRWGFCLSHNQLSSLKDVMYHVVIESEIKAGELNYGELIIPGENKDEILLSTYICHPSMANNEISGPVVTSKLANWLNSLSKNRYTYRILFLPETIGSIVYLSQNAEYMKKHTIAGFVVTCVGDENVYSYLPSREGNTLADRVAKNTLKMSVKDFIEYSFLDRGSDERQYCSPGIDLPVCSVMRSKYGTYPEYHTSLDNMNFITPNGLEDSFNLIKKIITIIESNYIYECVNLCEPHLGRYGMRDTISSKNQELESKLVSNILAYTDGKNDLIDLSNIINEDPLKIFKLELKLDELGLIKKISK